MAANNTNRPYKNRRQPEGPGIEQQVVEGIFKGLWWLISLPFKKRAGKQGKSLLSAATAQQLAGHWQQVTAKAGNPATYDLAIAEADKLLDAAFREIGLPGQTMGERLRAGEALFPQGLYNQIWEAHKLRNRLAHEVGVQISESETKAALSTFQWALRQLGVFI